MFTALCRALILAAGLAQLGCGRTEIFAVRLEPRPQDAGRPSPEDGGSPPDNGCADGTREGFTDETRWPSIAACAGTWSGFIDGSAAAALCSHSWHVCRGDAPALKRVAFEDARAFAGCFAFDAAHDCNDCYATCRGAIGTCQKCCVSNGPLDADMAGAGAGCTVWASSGAGQSCFATGRTDATTNDFGCQFRAGLTGVVCCRD